LAVLGCNNVEPAFRAKSQTLAQLGCPVLADDHTLFQPLAHVIKPENLSGKVGVGMETRDWTLEICESEFGMRCLKQPYHSGPYEIRLCKDGPWGWKKPFVFLAGWKYQDWADAPNFEIGSDDIPWIGSLQACIDSTFVQTPYLSVDIRADPYTNSFLVLEINGGMGIGFEWVRTYDIRWLFSRILSGIFSLRGLARVGDAIEKVTRRQELVHKWVFETL